MAQVNLEIVLAVFLHHADRLCADALFLALKAEFFLPTVVSALLARDAATVQVLPSHDRWYGVTYKEDKPVVVDALRRLAEEGLYPTPLWG